MPGMKCDLCDNPAVVHEVTVKSGEKQEVHLCEEHARDAGIVMPANQPLQELLTQFVVAHPPGEEPNEQTPPSKPSARRKAGRKECPTCGLSFARFRQCGVVGCADCYDAFEQHLGPLIERAQNGRGSHAGKSPRRDGASIDRQLLIQQLLRELNDAVTSEQYERAATLRDRLTTLNDDPSPATDEPMV